LPACFSERVSFTVNRRIGFLYAAVVATPETIPVRIEQSRTDRNATFRKTDSRFLNSNRKHFFICHCAILTKMDDRFKEGDFLFYQLEAGFALMRLLTVDEIDGENIWHVAAFRDLYLDLEQIEAAVTKPASLELDIPHIALTERAFAATQVATVGNSPLTDDEQRTLHAWRDDPNRAVSDRSIRLITGLR
jgi:hypothetical protein